MGEKNKPLVYVTLFSSFWALAIITQKYAFKLGANPITIAPQTLLISCVFLLIYIAVFDKFKFGKVSRKSTYGALVSGIIGGGLANFASIYGLNFTTSINAGFLIKTSAAFTVILAFIFLKEPITKAKSFFLTVLLLGAYMLSTKGVILVPKVGDIFILLAAFGFSSAAVLNRFVIKKDIHPDLVSLYRALMGFVVTYTIALFVAHDIFVFTNFWVVVLIAFFQAGVYIYLNKTLSVASASYMTMMSMMTPVIVALFAYPLFSERLTTIQIFGALFIVIGGVFIQQKKVAVHNT